MNKIRKPWRVHERLNFLIRRGIFNHIVVSFHRDKVASHFLILFVIFKNLIQCHLVEFPMGEIVYFLAPSIEAEFGIAAVENKKSSLENELVPCIFEKVELR